ncbi:MAG: glycosyltransferase family 2 protein [Muribaculaceae bacterium]|nr:glycosyltransferase family 2 protein [Muribaculaceae bacterium]
MKDLPKVAVLMPAYKQAEYIREALDSLQAQTYTDWECAVVDDGSPDAVATIVEEYSRRDARIRFYHTPNHGVSAARNYAASVTSAPFIIPLDADDTFEPEYIQECIDILRNNPDVRVVYSHWQFFGATSYTPPLVYTDYRDLLMTNRIFCSAMYRRADFERIGGYDENIPFGFEDWEFWIRLLAPTNSSDNAAPESNSGEDTPSDKEIQPGKVIQIDRALFNYRIKQQSRSTAVDSVRSRREECLNYIYNKNLDIYNHFFPDFLNILNRYADFERRLDKWRHRSLLSRLWHALTGKI